MENLGQREGEPSTINTRVTVVDETLNISGQLRLHRFSCSRSLCQLRRRLRPPVLGLL